MFSLFSATEPKLNFLRLSSNNLATNNSKFKEIIWNHLDSIEKLDSNIFSMENQNIKIKQNGHYQFMLQGVVQKEKIYFEKTTINLVNVCSSLLTIYKDSDPISIYYDTNSSNFINISLYGIVELKENDTISVGIENAILAKGIKTEFNLIKL